MVALLYVLSSLWYVVCLDFKCDQVRELSVNVYSLGFGSRYCGGIFYLVMTLILGYFVCTLFWMKSNLIPASLIAWLFSLLVCKNCPCLFRG